jgi:hypothetical protein
MTRFNHRKAIAYLWAFGVFLAVMIVLGYQVGADFAHKENVQSDNAIEGDRK